MGEIIKIIFNSPFRNLLMGMGLYYATYHKKYYQYCMCILIPHTYVGYHACKQLCNNNYLKF